MWSDRDQHIPDLLLIGMGVHPEKQGVQALHLGPPTLEFCTGKMSSHNRL